MCKNEDGKKERREDVSIKEKRGEEVDKGKRKWRKNGREEQKQWMRGDGFLKHFNAVKAVISLRVWTCM